MPNTTQRLDRIEAALETLAATAIKHDDQIEGLLQVAEKQQAQIGNIQNTLDRMAEEIINTQREWQAYLRRIPPQ